MLGGIKVNAYIERAVYISREQRDGSEELLSFDTSSDTSSLCGFTEVIYPDLLCPHAFNVREIHRLYVQKESLDCLVLSPA